MTTPFDALSRQQKQFVHEFLATGNAYASALSAGYSDVVAASAGDILLRNDLIKRAIRAMRSTIRESVRQKILMGTVDAVGAMTDIVRDDAMPPAARIQAARELMSLSGMAPSHSDLDEEGGSQDTALDTLPPAKVSLALVEGGKRGR